MQDVGDRGDSSSNADAHASSIPIAAVGAAPFRQMESRAESISTRSRYHHVLVDSFGIRVGAYEPVGSSSSWGEELARRHGAVAALGSPLATGSNPPCSGCDVPVPAGKPTSGSLALAMFIDRSRRVSPARAAGVRQRSRRDWIRRHCGQTRPSGRGGGIFPA